MKTIKNRITLETISTLLPQNPVALTTNPNKTKGYNRIYFPALITKIFTFCFMVIFLFTACKKEDEFIPSSGTANINDPYLKAGSPTFYIDPSGSDAANGDITHPWKTLAHACSQVTNPGNIIHVNAGTYTELSECVLAVGVSIIGEGSTTTIIKSHFTTTAGSTLPHASITLVSPAEGTMGNQSISNITLDGDGLQGSIGITVWRRSNVIIHDCVIADFFINGISIMGFNSPYTLGTYATGNQIYNCNISNCGDAHGTWDGHGVIKWGGQSGLLVHDNILTATSRAPGHNGNIANVGWYDIGCKYYNNKSYKNDYEDEWNFHIESWNCKGGFEVYNNEFHGGDCALDVAGSWNYKGNFNYSWYIHDNLFTGVPVSTSGGKVAIDIEGTSVNDVWIYNNHFLNLPRTIGQTNGTLGAATINNIYISGNLMENCGWAIPNQYYAIMTFRTDNTTLSNVYIHNNTIISSTSTSNIGLYIHGGGTVTNFNIKNNVFMNMANQGFLVVDNGGSFNGLNLYNNLAYNNAHSNLLSFLGNAVANYVIQNHITSNPMFVSTSDFGLQSGSPAIDKGVNVGLPFNGSAPDCGAFEYSTGGSANHSPQIQNQAFIVTKNSPNSTSVGSIVATDPDAGQTLTYSILSGNTNGAFAINASNGTLTVATSSAVNFEVTPSFDLIVKVQDNGTGNLSNQATITVSLTDVNEAPVISNQGFSIAENAANGTTVGTIIATDPNAGQTKTFSILSGNTNNAFIINTATGVLSVANSAALNFEVTPSFALVVKVQDNGTGMLSSQATITISLGDINEIPVIGNQSFSVAENSASGFTVGTVVASDPDVSQALSYLITAGNTSNAFTINTSTGKLTVNNSVALNFSVNPKFSLNVRVTDNGTGNLYKDATITVNIFQGFNQTPVIINQGFSINENSANGTTVGNVIATDPDAGQTKTFSILQGNTNGAFTISASTGVLTVANSAALDFEATPAFALTIKVQDNGTGSLSSQATITVSLIDINEAPVISNQSFSIAENSSVGTPVGTVMEYDPDYGQINTFSIISGNTNSAFTINTLTAVITVANSAVLDFETTSSFTLVVKVQDNGTGNLNSQATITISLLDVNEEPVINNQLFSITENSPNATHIGTVIATDHDSGQTMTFSIASGNTNGAIAINASTGALVVANQAALNFIINPIFSLGVKVTDNGTGNLFKIAIVTVSVLPVPNQPPVIINQTFTLNQNSPTGTSVGIVTATDPDAGQKLVYSILSGNTEGAFTINSSTGEILVSNSTTFHIKSSSSFALVVQVHDNGSVILSNQATVTVVMLAVNEAPLILNQTKSTLEHQPIGTIVGNISAYDPDSGIPVIFSITSGNIGNGFAIDANNGNLTINNPAAVCYEGNPVFNLNVKVQDNKGLTSEAIITVNVADINEKPLCNNQIFTINENAPEQTLVGSIVATENDFNQTLTYSIVSGNLQDAFTIDGSNGSIKVNKTSALNFERNKEFSLIVSVQDNGLGNLSTLSTITIKLTDVNESPEMGNQVLSVVENSAAGTEIGYLKASDPDTLQTVKYMIVGGNESQIFSLNATSGLLSVADPSNLNYGRNPLSTLTVIAQDNGTDSLSTLSIITINILRDSSQIIQTEGVSPMVNAFDEKDITIYPNPTSDIVNINLGEIADKQVSTRIINMNGIEVFSSVTKGEKKVVISMIDEKPGIYVAVITTDGQKYSRNFIVQN